MSRPPHVITDLHGKTIVITGASSGIGAAAARTFGRLGARVIVLGRNAARTEAVAAESGGVAVLVDFSNLEDVHRAAADVLKLAPKIDVLANNAGASWPKRSETKDGHEQMFQVNHLGPFLFTELLRPALVAAKGRVINTSSAGNLIGKVDLDDLETTTRFSGTKVYGTTKLENIMHASELAKRWAKDGVTAASFHPGIVATEFGRNDRFTGLFYRTAGRLMKTSDEGADTLIWLVTTRPGVDWENGGYYSNRKPGRTNKQLQREPELAAKLWESSVRLLQRKSTL